nr:probable palmitoyltransferase ZDHHC19 isoform X1 [Pogona vitticeps]
MGSSQETCQALTSGLFASFNFSTLVALSCLFFTFPCSWLAVNISWAFPIICGHLFIPTILYFLLTSFTDTGILHRGIDQTLMNQPVNMNDLNQHWCNKCQLYCLPHTSHCAWCDTCVEEFDHHCVWVNNCISCHNVRFFTLFVVFLSGYDLAVLTSCLVYFALSAHQGFSIEKICTVLVTIPAAFYLTPLLLLLCSQISRLLAAQQRCKSEALSSAQKQNHPTSCKWWNSSKKGRAKSALPGVRVLTLEPPDPSELHRVPRISSVDAPLPGSGTPDSLSRGQKALKAWCHFRSVLGSLLHRQDPSLGGAKKQGQDSQKKTAGQLKVPDRSMQITSE